MAEINIKIKINNKNNHRKDIIVQNRMVVMIIMPIENNQHMVASKIMMAIITSVTLVIKHLQDKTNAHNPLITILSQTFKIIQISNNNIMVEIIGMVTAIKIIRIRTKQDQVDPADHLFLMKPKDDLQILPAMISLGNHHNNHLRVDILNQAAIKIEITTPTAIETTTPTAIETTTPTTIETTTPTTIETTTPTTIEITTPTTIETTTPMVMVMMHNIIQIKINKITIILHMMATILITKILALIKINLVMATQINIIKARMLIKVVISNMVTHKLI